MTHILALEVAAGPDERHFVSFRVTLMSKRAVLCFAADTDNDNNYKL